MNGVYTCRIMAVDKSPTRQEQVSMSSQGYLPMIPWVNKTLYAYGHTPQAKEV